MTPLEVLNESAKIYHDRSLRYQGVWKNYGALANLVRSAQKIDRLMELWWFNESGEGETPLDKEVIDDAFDAINHLAFFVSCATGGNILGSQRERPDEFMEVCDETGKVVRLFPKVRHSGPRK